MKSPVRVWVKRKKKKFACQDSCFISSHLQRVKKKGRCTPCKEGRDRWNGCIRGPILKTIQMEKFITPAGGFLLDLSWAQLSLTETKKLVFPIKTYKKIWKLNENHIYIYIYWVLFNIKQIYIYIYIYSQSSLLSFIKSKVKVERKDKTSKEDVSDCKID